MGRTRIFGKVEKVQKKYLILQETVNYLGVSEDIVRELRNSNLIKAYMINKKVYIYDLDSIDRFVQSRDILKV